MQSFNEQNSSKKHYIKFINEIDHSYSNKTSNISSNFIYLLKPKSIIYFLKNMPKNFTISTNNGSCKFNIDILIDTSPVIAQYYLQNPQNLKYHLHIDDTKNVLGKLEQIYQGIPASFYKNDYTVSNQIIKLLQIANFPSLSIYNPNKNIMISETSFFSYLQNNSSKDFLIKTQKNEYKCNPIGILSSEKIRDQFYQNPEKNEYFYDFEDKNGEFQTFCDIFNFSEVETTLKNIETIKRIANDLQVNCILDDIDKNYRFYTIIKENQELINENDELFDMLFNINTKTVSTVKNYIVKSVWIQSEDNVRELYSYIYHVIKMEVKLHPYLADLIVELDKESSENEDLKILKTLLTRKLMKSFGKSKFNCSFIYNLYKRGIISKDEIIQKIKGTNTKQIPENSSICDWFKPEIWEIGGQNLLMEFKNIETEGSTCDTNFQESIDKYREMLSKGEPEDEITRALWHDDVDSFKALVEKSQLSFHLKVPLNIFDNISYLDYIDYAAAKGSIKCFKYMMSKNVQINPILMQYAISGGNLEIVKIVEQYNTGKPIELNQHTINLLINRHKNDLLDWMIEKGIINYKQSIDPIKSAKSSNIHLIIKLLEKGFISFLSQLYHASAKKGFYRMTKIIYDFYKNNPSENKDLVSNKHEDDVNFIVAGNLSIFKLFINDIQKSICVSLFQFALIHNCFSNIKVFLEYLIEQKKYEILNDDMQQFLIICIKNNDVFKFLFQKFTSLSSTTIHDLNFFTSRILPNVCRAGNFELVKLIVEYLLKNDEKSKEDYAVAFINAAKYPEICKYLIEKNVYISYNYLAINAKELIDISIEIFKLIYERSSPLVKKNFLKTFLYPVIRGKKYELVEYLLNLNAPCENALIEAVYIHDLDLVNIVLNHTTDPQVINKQLDIGTSLILSIQNDDLPIFKRLISIPNIDVTLCNSKNESPIGIAINNLNVEMVKSIFDFHGDQLFNNPYEVINIVKAIFMQFSELRKSLKTSENVKPENWGNSQRKIFDDDKYSKIKEIFLYILNIKSINFNYYEDTDTFLTIACSFKDIELVTKLLSLDNIDPNLFIPNSGNTPLMFAVAYKSKTIFDLLIKHPRIDINIQNYKGQTALFFAVLVNDKYMIESLINNEKFDPRENYLNFLFYSAPSKISKILITSKYVDVNYISNENVLKSKLVIAANSGDIELVDLIINHPSFNKDDSNFKDALFCSTENNEIFEKLIKLAKDDINDYYINENINPFSVALNLSTDANNYPLALKIILSNPHFIYPNRDIFNDFTSVFQSACNSNLSNIYVEVLNLFYQYDKAHDHCIDLNQAIQNGQSFFTFIKSNRSCISEVINFLLENGADPNAPDSYGIYPLEHAIKINSKVFVLDLLNSNKINLSIKIKCDEEGKNETFFDLAEKVEDKEILNELKRKEASNIQIQNPNNNEILGKNNEKADENAFQKSEINENNYENEEVVLPDSFHISEEDFLD